MKKTEGDRIGYVQKVREGTRQYMKDLLAENENLRRLAARLETEKQSLEDQVASLKTEVHGQQEQTSRLKERLVCVEEENHHFSEQYVEVEQSNSNLANLYVASYRLHSTLDRATVLATIQEIIINLIGSEELGVFELEGDRSALSLVSFFRIDPGSYNRIPLGSGIIGRTAQTGEPFIEEKRNGNARLPEEANLTSCIPLKVDGKVTGAVAIFKLLQQKSGLEAVDHELLHLLATHAATALFCTRADQAALLEDLPCTTQLSVTQ